MNLVTEKFLKYVKIDTQSAETEGKTPSTDKQRILAALLRDELVKLGAGDIWYDEEHCYVYAGIPGNTQEKAPVLGLIAHMDTSPAVSGANVNPRIIENYDGRDIILNQKEQTVLSVKDFPELQEYKGKDLIVTDGTTLLGADDKAGIAEIMTLVQYLSEHPEFEHGEIRIAFTPDEEVGHGTDYFDLERFAADFAYTVDGGKLGELEYENFNAAGAKLTVRGRSVHPGSAKNTMRNAILIAQEFQNMLPCFESPMCTDGYEGFYHPDTITGNVEQVKADYIIRDHSREKFEEKKQRMLKTAEFLNEKYGSGTVSLEIRDSYYNMKEKIEPHMHLIEHAKQAMEQAGVTPIITPIRGGTDGARLSYMGLPCPNLCTGGHNYHGRYEYVCIQSMEKVVEILLNILKLYTEKW